MIKQLVALNAGLYGAYFIANGPIRTLYKQYLTLGSNSSILSVASCHLGHTSATMFALNSAVLWTIGNQHAHKYGCARLMKLIGFSCAVASVIGLHEVYHNGGQVINGGSAVSAGLVTYNLFRNPQWFHIIKVAYHPMILLSLMAFYGA